MTEAPSVIKATDVRVGDRLRARSGVELTVTRIDEGFMGRAEMLAFVEDSATQWFKDARATRWRRRARRSLI